MSSDTLWVAIVIASAVALGTKVAGEYLPKRWFSSPKIQPIVGLITVALLAGLVTVQSFTTGHKLVLDARVVALAVAAVALWRKAPFIVVVIVAAATAAGLRALGWS